MGLIGREAPRPFLRIPYAEAIARYGSDKPDLRCGMEIRDLSAAFRDRPSPCSAARSMPEARSAASSCPARARYSRREFDEVVEQAKQLGAAGWSGRARPRVRCRARRSRPRAKTPFAARSRSRSRARRSAAHGSGQARGRRRSCSEPAAAAGSTREPARPVDVCVPVGGRLPDVRVGRGGAAPRVHAPPVHVAARERRRRSSRAIRAARARAPTISC